MRFRRFWVEPLQVPRFNHIPEAWVRTEDLVLEDAIIGSILSQYRFNKYKQPELDEEPTIHYLANSDDALRRARMVADAVSFARDLGNEPAGS